MGGRAGGRACSRKQEGRRLQGEVGKSAQVWSGAARGGSAGLPLLRGAKLSWRGRRNWPTVHTLVHTPLAPGAASLLQFFTLLDSRPAPPSV